MLRGDADFAVKARVSLERGDDWEQLDRLGACAEDDEDGGGRSHWVLVSMEGLTISNPGFGGAANATPLRLQL